MGRGNILIGKKRNCVWVQCLFLNTVSFWDHLSGNPPHLSPTAGHQPTTLIALSLFSTRLYCFCPYTVIFSEPGMS